MDGVGENHVAGRHDAARDLGDGVLGQEIVDEGLALLLRHRDRSRLAACGRAPGMVGTTGRSGGFIVTALDAGLVQDIVDRAPADTEAFGEGFDLDHGVAGGDFDNAGGVDEIFGH